MGHIDDELYFIKNPDSQKNEMHFIKKLQIGNNE